MRKLLKENAEKINIKLSEDEIEKFILYKDILKEWNEKINLTAITDDREIIIKHFIDSLTIEKYIPQNARVVDVGTGAGFPGIPLKIVREDIEVVLLDSLNKRVNFLNEIIIRCNLKNISAVHGRAEDTGRLPEYRETFDVSTARAVANTSVLLEYCTPFLKKGGKFICMKSNAENEIEEARTAMNKLNMKIECIDEIKLEEIDADRTIIVYEKTESTPKEYPRKAGTVAKNPIK